MYEEGPILLSLKEVDGQNTLHQLLTDLKSCVASKGFRLDIIRKSYKLKNSEILEIPRSRLLSCCLELMESVGSQLSLRRINWNQNSTSLTVKVRM